jgi:hypothetical protein
VTQRGAVGGDVVCDELSEERPARRDRRVALAVGTEVGWPSRSPQLVECSLVGHQRRQVVEQAAVAPTLDRRVDSLGREAVVAGDRLGAHE